MKETFSPPFFEAAKSCDWLASASERLCAGIFKTEAALPTRLRAIKLGAEVLLEHSYAMEGRLEATHFMDGCWVRYEYDEMARMVRVNLSGSRFASRQFCADGYLEPCIYAGGERFDFGYDHARRLARVQYSDRVTKVVAVLDHGSAREAWQKEGKLRVNWLLYRKPSDFERVEIARTGSTDVEEFVQQVRFQSDRRLRRMECVVGDQARLEEKTLRVLRPVFGRLEKEGKRA